MVAVMGMVMLFATTTMQAEPSEETKALATEANLAAEPVDWAVKTVAAARGEPVDVRQYLIDAGHLAPPTPPLRVRDWIDDLLSCLAWYESRHTPTAVNRSSGASGWLQFLPSTFRQTPPGRRGESIWSVAAQLEAGRWMINQGRLKEWAVWRMCV